MFKNFVVSMFLGLSLVFGAGAMVAPQTVSAYQGETQSEFVNRVLYGQWMFTGNGDTLNIVQGKATVSQIYSCDVVNETASLSFRSNTGYEFRADIFCGAAGGYGMIIHQDGNEIECDLTMVKLI